MMKKFILSSVLLLMAVMVMAAPVSQEKAEQIATFFFREHGGKGKLEYLHNDMFSHLHIYRGAEGKGFVIMSADDCVFPILGYSASNPIKTEDMVENIRQWLEGYEREIEWNIKNECEVSHDVTEAWERLEKMIPEPQQTVATDTTYNTANLLATTWDQSPYYNAQCPYDSAKGKRTLTGCVATAMGQVMKYWGHPDRGRGQRGYTHSKYGTLSANFADTVFNYAAMPNSLDANSTAEEVNAVALLLSRCGISVEMNYSTSGSGAQSLSNGSYRYASAENSLREYFKYMHTLHGVSLANYTDAEWYDLIVNEINNGRPVLYSANDVNTGGGHAFVCCGYDNTGKLYFNWGWGGYNDGYYKTGQLNPGSHRYNDDNDAVIGIEPDLSGATTTTVTVTTSDEDAGTVTGGGTYTSYMSEATIKAKPNAGYLFKNWDGSNTYITYMFLANGDSVTHTANFEKLQGDTVGYCYDNPYLNYRSSSSGQNFWGIRLDSNAIGQNKKLVKVSAYLRKEGTYMVHIFSGATTSHPNQVLSDTVTIASSSLKSWVTIPLSKEIRVNRKKGLWIVLETTCSGYPISASHYRGSPEGSYMSQRLYNGWYNWATTENDYMSFQLRGIFQDDPTAEDVGDVAVDEEMRVYTEGGSIVVEGEEGEEIRVYDAAGKMVAGRRAGSDRESIGVSSGVYFVRIDGKTRKVIVK